mgnify:FL=1
MSPSALLPPRPTPRAVPLAEVLAQLDAKVPLGAPAVVTGAAMDSRRVQPGDLYIAVPGTHHHGAMFAADVAERGAVCILTDAAGADLAGASALPVVTVADPRAVAGEVAARAFGRPADALTMVGITGTNGKTTMSFLLEAIFRQAGHTTGVIGTTGHHAAGERIPSERTTPEAVEVHALLGYMRELGVDTVVMEVSSHAMTFGRVNGITFDAAVFTNLTQDHLDFHGSMADYYAAKRKLFDRCEASVVCIDDRWGRRLRGELADAVTYSLADPQADWYAASPQSAGSGSRFDLHGPAGVAHAAHVVLPGDFNIANSVGAIATASVLGVPWQQAIAGVAACTGVPGRMQPVPNQRGLRAFVDYAHTPDAVARAVAAVTGPVVVVLGCGGDRDTEKRPLMGEVAARLAQFVVITDDNPRSEDPASIRAALKEGAMSVPPIERAQIREVADRRAAITTAVEIAPAGAAVLVLGKGHEQGQQVGAATLPFDDATELAAALQGDAE